MSQAVPKLIQRFRARELQRLVVASGLPKSSLLKGGKKDVPLHNPFLPRPLFKVDANVEASSNPAENADTYKPADNNVNVERNGDKKKKERKKWMEARYSLRRQAVLVKQARKSGTLHLLPPGPKLSVEELEAARCDAQARGTLANTKTTEVAETEGKSTTNVVSSEIVEAQSATQLVTRSSSEPKRAPTGRRLRRSVSATGHPSVVFHWTGKVRTKTRKGLTIYAGRRRMFKGHKWERHLDKRRGQIAVRMRDMPKRIQRFKNVYRRRRPDPLKPAAPRKKETLPF